MLRVTDMCAELRELHIHTMVHTGVHTVRGCPRSERGARSVSGRVTGGLHFYR